MARDGWQTIRPGLVEELPDGPGVVVLGSLVRNVLFVANASEGIRAAVRSALSRPELRAQARCVKVEPSDEPAQRHAEILAAYRASHGGALPPVATPDLADMSDVGRARSRRGTWPQPNGAVVARIDGARAEAPRPEPTRSAPARYSIAEPTFLRVRTVA
ncbi:MAG TPA: hypothetical protein VFD92_16125 [Candidatus Binatia bacterium]|nr:hypothetical protein [Candidatus Binatia bacterium]